VEEARGEGQGESQDGEAREARQKRAGERIEAKGETKPYLV
jgi:hypothetical protein